MNFNQCVLVVATLAITIVISDSASPAEESNLRLLSFMSRSNGAIQENPSRSLACFTYYIPQIDELTRKYEKDYVACEEDSKEKSSQVEAATSGNRKDLGSLANNSCSSLNKCQHIESAEKAFECFINGGSENANKMKSINANASNYLFNLQEELRLVKIREHVCTNETRRVHEQENTQTLDALNNCVLGNAPIPNTTTKNVIIAKPSEKPKVAEIPKGPESPKDFDNVEDAQEIPSRFNRVSR